MNSIVSPETGPLNSESFLTDPVQESALAKPPLQVHSPSEYVEQALAGRLEDSLGYAVKRAQVRCDEALIELLPADLSPTRMTALAMIEANPGITQAALGVALHIAAPSVVKVVDTLERLGLVERQASPLDRRIYALVLTAQGRTELQRCDSIVARSEREVAAKLSKAERALLIELLSRVAT